jgi:cell volume regulation protein A
MLEMESGSNDPFAYMLTVIVLSFMKGENSVGQMVYSIAAQIVFGVLIGFLIALGAVWFMKHFTFNTSGFDAAFVLGVAVLAYALPTLVGGNGYLSAYIVGIVLGNQNIHANAYIFPFGTFVVPVKNINCFVAVNIYSTVYHIHCKTVGGCDCACTV